MPTPRTPEELLRDSRSSELILTLRCTRCGTTSKKERFAWACVNPNLEACKAAGWDGVSLSRIFRCAKCGAVDAYQLEGDSYLKLTAGVLGAIGAAPEGRVILGDSRLWDGTQARRPSQIIARLRELADQHKDSAEAWLRLGNGCERYGQLEEAVAAWRRAIELDQHELSSLASLAAALLKNDRTAKDGFEFLRRAITAIPQPRKLEAETKRDLVRGVFAILRSFPEQGAPLALLAGWREGSTTTRQPLVRSSSVDLREVLEVWDALVDFAASPEVLALELTHELPSDPQPQLLRLLRAGSLPPPPANSLPVKAAPQASRNDPCPCGSGLKFKKCCLGKTAT